MNFSPSESSKHQSPDDESGFSTLGLLIGTGLGLLATLLIGRWLPNAVVGGLVGFLAGALIDRSRR